MYKIKGSYKKPVGLLSNSYTKKLDLTYVIKTSKTIAIASNPSFSNYDSSSSNWSNSIPYDNGETMIDISLESIALSDGNNTCTIKARVNPLKWGTKDVTVTLNVDNIKTLS